MFISDKNLLELAANTSSFFKGKVYWEENRVQNFQATGMLDDGWAAQARVCGSARRVYDVHLFCTHDGSAMHGDCSCPAFESYGAMCKHMVALALALRDFVQFPQGHPQKTDVAMVRMLHRYAQTAMTQSVAGTQASCAVLETVLEVKDYNKAVLSFKVGEERLYVLKNLEQFVRDMQEGNRVSYGKNYTLLHSLLAFRETCRPLVEFVMAYASQGVFYGSSSGYVYGVDVRRHLFLEPHIMDAFVHTLKVGDVLTCVAWGGTFAVRMLRQNPELTLYIQPTNGQAHSLRLSEKIILLRGMRNAYVLTTQALYCCDLPYSEATAELLQTISDASGQNLIVSDTDLPVLAGTLLPELRGFLSIEMDNAVADAAPPLLESSLYLDMPYADQITARLEFSYSTQKHPAFTAKTLNRSFDLRGEVRAETMLTQYMDPPQNEQTTLTLSNDPDRLYQFICDGLPQIAEVAEIYATDAFKSMQVRKPAAVSMGVRVESDLMKLHFDLGDLSPSELPDILSSYRQKKKYHRLRDGSFLTLEGSALGELTGILQGMGVEDQDILSEEISVPRSRALYLDAALKKSEQMRYDRDGSFKQIVRGVRDAADADFTVPDSLRNVLRHYQKTGYRWMQTLNAYAFGGILADDMGLGKTVQVLALLLSAKETESAQVLPSLVVCPSSLVLNWESEAGKFVPDLRVSCIAGVAAQRHALLRDLSGTDLLITSYDALKRDVEEYENIHFHYVIADEAQYMKNHSTQNAKAVKAVHAQTRLALTGTPIENSLAELWSVFDFLMPGYLFPYARFRRQFETPIVRQGDENAAHILQEMVRPFIMRRMKKDVLRELPEKSETVLYAEMEGEQKTLYAANAVQAAQDIAVFGQGDQLQVLALLTRLRQICCDPGLVYADYAGSSAKRELCLDLLRSCSQSGHKVLLFSQFTSMLALLAEDLKRENMAFYTITGQTKASERLQLVNRFNMDETPVFLISLKAGGTGLNLTGADVVIHYDPWWNLSAQNQASDRAHRIGQKRRVQIYKLVTHKSIEEGILKIQKDKAELADLIVREGDSALARMSKEDVLQLFA